MTHPGVKFRGGDRWLTPQPHEFVFRAVGGEEPVSPPTVVESTAAGVSDDLVDTLTIPDFEVPLGQRATRVIVVGTTAQNEFGSGAVDSITWNSRSFTLAGTYTGLAANTLQLWYLLAADEGVTDDIVITYDEVVSIPSAHAYLIEGAANEAPEAVDDNEVVAGGGTISSSVTTGTLSALVTDAMFNMATNNPAAAAAGQTEIAGAEEIGAASALSASWALGPTPPGSRAMDWSNLGAGNNTVQLMASWKPGAGGSAPTQPVTAKLVLGWDFSGADSVVTVTGQGISDVTDSSGNGNAGVQNTDASRPLYGGDNINGELIADSADARFLVIPGDVAGWTSDFMPPYHMLIVCSLQAVVNNDYLLAILNAGAAPRAAIRVAVSGGNRIRAYFPASGPASVNVLSTETAIATGTTYLIETSVDGSGNASLTINEGTPATVSGAADSGEALTLRRLFDSTSPADAFVGGVYLFNDVLTGPELAEWRTFLKARWGYV